MSLNSIHLPRSFAPHLTPLRGILVAFSCCRKSEEIVHHYRDSRLMSMDYGALLGLSSVQCGEQQTPRRTSRSAAQMTPEQKQTLQADWKQKITAAAKAAGVTADDELSSLVWWRPGAEFSCVECEPTPADLYTLTDEEQSTL